MANLSFLAGKKALVRLRTEGLNADSVKVVAGASGAAKWLVLSQLDRAIFGNFFQARRDPLFLLGSSIGSWRFAAVSQKDPLRAIDDFEIAYIRQSYREKPTAETVTRKSYEILDQFFPKEALDEVIQHPTHRLSLLSVRSRWATRSETKFPLSLGLGGAALSNALSPAALKLFFERTLFFDARTPPPYLQARDFRAQSVSLSVENLRPAIMASGSIPLVMQGIRDIEGARPGIYRDGGIIDYHLDVPFLAPEDKDIVLFPHFQERLIPGWFDKNLPWRRANADRMAHVLLVAPSPEFVARLPFRKIPDRTDFYRFQGRDEERFRYWRQVTQECQRLADEFMEVVEKGLIAERARPLV